MCRTTCIVVVPDGQQKDIPVADQSSRGPSDTLLGMDVQLCFFNEGIGPEIAGNRDSPSVDPLQAMIGFQQYQVAANRCLGEVVSLDQVRNQDFPILHDLLNDLSTSFGRVHAWNVVVLPSSPWTTFLFPSTRIGTDTPRLSTLWIPRLCP